MQLYHRKKNIHTLVDLLLISSFFLLQTESNHSLMDLIENSLNFLFSCQNKDSIEAQRLMSISELTRSLPLDTPNFACIVGSSRKINRSFSLFCCLLLNRNLKKKVVINFIFFIY